MMDADTGEPFKGGRGDIVIFPHAQDGRVRIEPAKNRIVDYMHLIVIPWSRIAGIMASDR
jgi:hypothetical protein